MKNKILYYVKFWSIIIGVLVGSAVVGAIAMSPVFTVIWWLKN